MDVPKIGMHLDLAADDDVRWHRDAKFLERALATLADSGLGIEFERMDVGKDEVPFDRKVLAKATAADKTTMIELWTKSGEHVTLTVGGILAGIKLRKIAPSKSALDGLITWARAVAKLPEGRARVRLGTVYPIDLEYPARRPPVSHDLVRLGTTVDFFGPAWLSERSPDLARLVSDAKLPAGASRIHDEELIVLRWATDPRTPEDLAEACIRQEDWWRSHVSMAPDGGWTAEGDRAVYPAGLESGAPFTLIDRAEHVGYRAVVVMPDGTLEGASWSEIAKLTAMNQLADGTAIDRVRLIVPVRDNAIAIAARARELGVEAVLYRDGDTLFDVMPSGNWRVAPAAESQPARRSR